MCPMRSLKHHPPGIPSRSPCTAIRSPPVSVLLQTQLISQPLPSRQSLPAIPNRCGRCPSGPPSPSPGASTRSTWRLPGSPPRHMDRLQPAGFHRLRRRFTNRQPALARLTRFRLTRHLPAARLFHPHPPGVPVLRRSTGSVGLAACYAR
jgi:hypothetical protein